MANFEWAGKRALWMAQGLIDFAPLRMRICRFAKARRIYVRQVLGMLLTFMWIVIEPTTAAAIGYGDSFMGWGSSFGLGHMFFGGAMMIAFWGAIVLLFVVIHRVTESRTQRLHSASKQCLSLSLLNERYARGDIDHDEFEKRRQTLLQSNGSV